MRVQKKCSGATAADSGLGEVWEDILSMRQCEDVMMSQERRTQTLEENLLVQ